MAFTHILKVYNGPVSDIKKSWYLTEIRTIENTDAAIAEVAQKQYKNYSVKQKADKWR